MTVSRRELATLCGPQLRCFRVRERRQALMLSYPVDKLLGVVRIRPLMSVAVSGGRYSVCYSACRPRHQRTAAMPRPATADECVYSLANASQWTAVPRGEPCESVYDWGQCGSQRLFRTYCLGVHFMIGFDLDVPRSEVVCGVFE